MTDDEKERNRLQPCSVPGAHLRLEANSVRPAKGSKFKPIVRKDALAAHRKKQGLLLKEN